VETSLAKGDRPVYKQLEAEHKTIQSRLTEIIITTTTTSISIFNQADRRA
jgi:hypothetical protein